MLASCLDDLEVATGIAATSIAFPAIWTCIVGYPRQPAAEIAVTTTIATASRRAGAFEL